MKYLVFYLLLLLPTVTDAQDRNLEYYIRQAGQNSPLLKDYQQQLQAGKIDSALLRATYNPQVNGISSNSYAPLIKGYGYDNAISNGGQISAIVQANKTFVGKKNLASQLSTIQLQNAGISTTAAIAEQDLKRTITTQYILTYGDFVTLDFNNEILHLYQNEEKILKKLTEANIYKQADYLLFYVSLQQQQLICKQAEVQYKSDFATLNYLAGITDTSAYNIPDPALQISTLPDIFQSPFYQQYAIDSLKYLNQRMVLNYNYKPKLIAYADAGYQSTLAIDPYKNFGTSIGIGITVPIYDGHQRKLKTQKIAISEKVRQGYRDFFLLQYNQQVMQLLQQLHATQTLIPQIENQVKYAYTLIAVNEKLLGTGDIRITDYILAINTYLNAKHLFTQNYINRQQITNQLNYWNR
ncbi:MAG: TolC family protein [Chitinophaga sp.]|uniref:TolC family protein n=1 Tax=Chitinophaga sp. TaxID=1869181 RepID=UPI0025BAB7DA|nr:TolC family protein [Chitinophaga sp.]MBV8253646.1 TolC family protein [Chitinophaga sp.]